jgi:hypothetical protein
VLDDVTMKHPVAGIVGDKGDLGRLVGQKEQDIGMVLGPAQFVRADQFESMAVDMDRVSERRTVLLPRSVRISVTGSETDALRAMASR